MVNAQKSAIGAKFKRLFFEIVRLWAFYMGVAFAATAVFIIGGALYVFYLHGLKPIVDNWLGLVIAIVCGIIAGLLFCFGKFVRRYCNARAMPTMHM